ncbi:MAG TPA: hypothetical protein VGN37_25180 [Actinocatenispora sp.]
MADSDGEPDHEDVPAADPPAPRRPGKLLLVLLAIGGLVLIAAPFTFAALGTRGEPVETHAIGGGIPAPGATSSAPSASASASPSAVPDAAKRSAAPTRTKRPTFTAVAGPTCPITDTAAYRRVGSFYQGHEGWLHFGGDTCTTRTDSMPMSGDAGKADPGLYAEWDFRTDTVQRGTCDIQIHVADRADIRYNGGDPAHYDVYGAIGGGTPIRRFTIVQQSHLDSWVPAGKVSVTDGELRIVATDQGQDWEGTVKTYRHIGVGAIRVTCTG